MMESRTHCYVTSVNIVMKKDTGEEKEEGR